MANVITAKHLLQVAGKNMESEWLDKILKTKITRRTFLVFMGKFFILIILLSYLPLKWIKNNGRPLKMNIKQFKEEYLYQQHSLAG